MPGLDGVGDAVAALEVRGPDVGGETVLGGVGQLDRLGLVVERGDGDDGAEDLLLEDAGVAFDVGEDGGLEVVAVRQVVGAACRPRPGGPPSCRSRRSSGPARSAPGGPARRPRWRGRRAARRGRSPPARPVGRVNSSYNGRSTRTREPAVQRSPLRENTPNTTESRAASRSASANTTAGDLPPSSIEMVFRCSADERMMCRPVSVEPVKEISGTSGWSTRACAGLLADAVHDVDHPGRDARLGEDLRPQATPTAASTRRA